MCLTLVALSASIYQFQLRLHPSWKEPFLYFKYKSHIEERKKTWEKFSKSKKERSNIFKFYFYLNKLLSILSNILSVSVCTVRARSCKVCTCGCTCFCVSDCTWYELFCVELHETDVGITFLSFDFWSSFPAWYLHKVLSKLPTHTSPHSHTCVHALSPALPKHIKYNIWAVTDPWSPNCSSDLMLVSTSLSSLREWPGLSNHMLHRSVLSKGQHRGSPEEPNSCSNISEIREAP